MNLQGRNLQQDFSGDDVRLLHAELALLHFVIPDNERQGALFGPGTLAAVQDFQKQHTLPISGIVDSVTAAAINAAVNALSTGSPQLTISATQLSYGTQGDDVARLQQAVRVLGRIVPVDEVEPPVLGAGTVAVVKALQQDLGVPVTGVVDGATVRAINAKLASLATDQRVVRGFVRDANGNPAKGLTVSAFSQGPAGEAPVGSPVITADDGSYTLPYIPPPAGRVDLRIQVGTTSADPRPASGIVVLETTPSSASILTRAGPLEVVNFVLSGATNPPKSEYERILSDIAPLLGSRALASLVEDATHHDISLLATQSGYSGDRIAALVTATRLANDAKVPAPVIYGLLRQGLPAHATALAAVQPDERLKALRASIDKGLVPKRVDGRSTEDYLAGFASVSAAPLQPLLGNILSADDLDAFVARYSKSSEDPVAFWKQIAADPVLGGRAAKLQFTVQVAGLTNNHVPLVNAVSALADVKQASDLVRLSEDNWRSLIQAQGVGVPTGTPGVTSEEKTNNYVRQIVAQVEAAFPTGFFAARLPASPVKTFLQAQSSFDLLSTYPAQFFKSNPTAAQGLTRQDQGQLLAFQRIHRLTRNTKETLALSASVHSAQQISRMDRQAFAEQFKDTLATDRADGIYDQALRTKAAALALYAEHGADLNRTAMRALPTLNIQRQADLAKDSIPDWQTLFGAFDFCACQECASVHGPAAYFVDILGFLGDRPGLPGKSVRDALFSRRPDLGDIELSCENTDTPVPLIDLANEILENAVAPPAAFAPFTLLATLEGDLAQPVATDSLAGAFSPRLQPGARVEVLETGKRWRIWDEPFAYSVTKDGTTLKVAARSRQTSGSPDERRAVPQYRNSQTCAELSTAVYPWNLPFDLASEEANVFLTHLGVARWELIEALRPMPRPFDSNFPIVVRLAAERLGLTDTKRKIIVSEPLNPPRQPEEFWGSATVAFLSTVQNLLDRSGLRYAQLDALIATWFINPTGTVSIAAKSGVPVDTCDTTSLQTNGLTADVLSRMQRFVRLWRAMGWTISEIDRAVHAFVPDPSPPALTNEVLVRLDHLRALCSQLRVSVVQGLAFWKPIDTLEPGSLYRNLFFNPAVFKPQEEDFRLQPDGKDLVHKDKLLTDHAAALQAVFRINAPSFTVLVAKTDGKQTLGNLSLLYRHALLARQLGLTVQDLLTAVDLTGLDPFRVDHSEDALRFIDVVKAIQGSGFTIPQLDYLLRQRFNPPAPFVPPDTVLAATLIELRQRLRSTSGPPEAKKSAVIDRVSAALGLPGDVAASLLDRVTHGGKTALDRFLDLSSIELPSIDHQEAPLTRDTAKPQFEILEKLLKVASIIQTVGLPTSGLDWLFRENAWLAQAPDPASPPVSFDNWYALIQLQQLRRSLNLGDGAMEAILGALTSLSTAAGQPAQLVAKKALVDTLSRWLGWPPDDLATLIGKPDDLADKGVLNVAIPGDYRLDLIARISRAMGLVKRLGVAADQASHWCDWSDNPAVRDAQAKAIRSAAKAKYDDDAWRKMVTPLQDSLRDKQREALVSYLVARPAKWNATVAKADANDLFTYFLIDVEMSSCQLTSRIEQAIGSVQLLAQRCLMGLEKDIQTSDGKWAQWDWMKNFRVWEANRKIFLYPENWIEPDLRDNKTPFFKDLESELLQSNLDNAAAEQALMRYLEKLDTVSRLEVAGVYEDDDNKVLHVFGRTIHTPHVYYYRRREGVTQSWTPWEKVDLDIEGDHLIPVMWNRKLMLIWPIFAEKQAQVPVTMPQPMGTLASADHYWEIQLAWSEYQYGRWSGKNLSEPVPFAAYLGDVNSVLFGPWFAPQEIGGTDGSPGGVPGDSTDGDTPPPPHPPGYSDPNTTSVQRAMGSSGAARELVPKQLFSFKAVVEGETLAIRGYLRRDYRFRFITRYGPDHQIACAFGEFRFLGCRNVVTSVPSQKFLWSFALAPTDTKFDRMWFTGMAPWLTLFDAAGPFPTIRLPLFALDTPASIAGDPSGTVAQKHNIPVLDKTPSTFQVLAPHQDPEFFGNRPFFFTDAKRAFMVTSTGGSGSTRPPIFWVDGNIATLERSDFFPVPDPQPPNGPSVSSLTLLVPGPRGGRVPTELPPINPQPSFSPPTFLPKFWTTRRYTFTNFHHPYLCDFIGALGRGGLPTLLSLETQSKSDQHAFDDYGPRALVTEHPIDEIEFQSGRAYELYNWELFFHIPLLIATRLSQNQRFEEAQRWFHFIFDPTGGQGGKVPQPYWRTKPFHDRVKGDYEAESVKTIETMAAKGPSLELKVAIEEWRSNPFSPHAVARLRTTAYQKTVVMKYVDNLIAWGDQLFRRDTLESINEATLLYVLAAEILGQRPEIIQRNLKPVVQTFNTLSPVGPLGNALEQIELLVPAAGGSASLGASQPPDPPSDKILYFCVPENDKLLGYWNSVGDRLFKIRHCMNIEGQIRQLPLFEPPIDPALLVRARAAGLSIRDVLSDIFSASLPNYRFSVMLQKATETVAEVKSLGAELLSVLEKGDAEALSTLRSGQELRLLQAVRDVRAKQVDEATANIAALQKSRDMAQARKDYYDSREFLSAGEQTSLSHSENSLVFLESSGALRTLVPALQALGLIKVGAPTTAGAEEGPGWLGEAMMSAASALDVEANRLSAMSQLAGRLAEYSRRQDEWDHQANLATIELQQIDQQLTASQIRLDIATQELRNHDQQIDDARNVDQFLRSKFTNQDLFQWMVGQISGIYFQSYQLAYDLAKRAETCMQHELGLKDQTSIIRFGYWDSIRKGLLAGDRLGYDLKRLEIAYLDSNIREYELTKNVSLLSLAPEQLLLLKATGVCEFRIPEWLFDLDTPGHYRRRIKMVSVTIPCVIGPYASVHCKLQLVDSSYRKRSDPTPRYEEQSPGPDPRFVHDPISAGTTMVTSTAQNDAGLFEPAMRDERYLPFEGKGAISHWRLELPKDFKTFDYSTITDVILHLRYTAGDGGDALRDAARTSVTNLLKDAGSQPLFRLFSLRHDFPTEWSAFVNGTGDFRATIRRDHFPYFTQGKKINIAGFDLYADDVSKHHGVGNQPVWDAATADLADKSKQAFTLTIVPDAPGPTQVLTRASSAQVFLIVRYSLSEIA